MIELVNADCNNYLDTLPKKCGDLFIIDPPYYKVVQQEWDRQWETLDDYIKWCSVWLDKVNSVAKDDSILYLFGYSYQLMKLLPIIEKLGYNLRQPIIIDKGLQSIAGRKFLEKNRFPIVTEYIFFYMKGNPYFDCGHGFVDVWRDLNFYGEKILPRIHPTQKPYTLISRLITTSSKESALVVDPFAGTGVVAVACSNLNREYRGCEIDTDMYKKSIELLKMQQKRQQNFDIDDIRVYKPSPKKLKIKRDIFLF